MQATTTTSCWQRVRARARAQGEGEANHATNHHRNARTHTHTRTLSIRLSAVRGIRYRHNRRAEPSSTGKSTAISAFPFTRITDSAWQAANHAAKAWPLHPALPFHCTPTLPAARPLDLAPPPPLLFFARSSRALFLFLLFSRDTSSVERERERNRGSRRVSQFRESLAFGSRTRAIHFDGASEPPRFFEANGERIASRGREICTRIAGVAVNPPGDSTGKFVPPWGTFSSSCAARFVDLGVCGETSSRFRSDTREESRYPTVGLIFFRVQFRETKEGGRRCTRLTPEREEGADTGEWDRLSVDGKGKTERGRKGGRTRVSKV